jgi:hypothetical protein
MIDFTESVEILIDRRLALSYGEYGPFTSPQPHFGIGAFASAVAPGCELMTASFSQESSHVLRMVGTHVRKDRRKDVVIFDSLVEASSQSIQRIDPAEVIIESGNRHVHRHRYFR